MRIRSFATATGAAVLLLTGLATTAPAIASTSVTASSSARVLPKIQAGIAPGGSSWYYGWKVRPRYVYFGGGAGYSAPRIKNVRWIYYNRHSAWATGRWLLDTCNPDCAQGGYFVNATAHFYDVVSHPGPGRNFAKVTVWWRDGRWSAYIDGRGEWVYGPIS